MTYVYDDDGSNVTTPAVSYEYDGFDRVTKQTDEEGNYVEFAYDRNSLIQSKKVYNSMASLLEHTVFNYDEANRMIQVSRELASPQDSLMTLGHTRVIPYVNRSADTLLSGEFVYSLVKYDEEGKIKHVCDDNAHHTTYDYDEADRLETVTDHLGSTVSYAYDQASNVIRITEVEKHTNGVDPDETYYRDQFFDELNRLVATVSHTGQTMRYMYDSRNNLVQVSDAMGQENTGQFLGDLPYQDDRDELTPMTRVTTVAINGRGNTVRYEYDGASRLLATHEDLRAGGVGMGAVLNSITTRQVWDANSRVEMRIDPKGNATGYRYDHQDRLIREMLADGRQTRYHYNNNGTLAMKVDPRGVVEEYDYDELERLTDVEVSNLPTGAGQTTFKHWDYDGLSRTTGAEDNDTICTYSYDTLSRVKQEGQSVGYGTVRNSKNDTLTSAVTGYVTRSYDGVGNLFRLYYPADHTGSTPGSNYVEREYDGVDRLSAVKRVAGGTTTIAEFEHIGMGGRRSERSYLPSSTNMTCEATFDDERRYLTLSTVEGMNTITSFAYGWDRADNRRYESDLVAGTGDFYTYDSAYRLTNVERGVSSTTLAALGNNKTSVTAPQGDWTKALSYHLDNSGNRTETWEGNSITPYTLDIGAPTYDSPLNQYTMLDDKIRSHDDSGNVTSDDSGATQRFFDCDNRLVQSDGATQDAEYRYDVQGRRVAKLLTGSVTASILYFYDGWQCVEETGTSGATTKTYVYGEGIDEVVRATIPEPTSVDIDGDMTTGEAAVDVYYHHNSIGSVMAVTNASGTVVESYSYKPYGAVTIKDHNGSEISATRIEQPWMFTGRRLDFEEDSGLYYFRARYYDPYAGRFLQRDPIYDAANLGNQYTYAANNPVNYLDPMGTDVTMSAGDAAAMGNIFGAGNITTRSAGNGQVTVGFSNSQAAAKASYDFVQRTNGDMSFRMKMWKALNSSRTVTMGDVRGGTQAQTPVAIDHSQDQEGVSRRDPLRMYGVPRSWVPVPGCPGQYQDYTLTTEYAIRSTMRQAGEVVKVVIIVAAVAAIPGPADEAALAGAAARRRVIIDIGGEGRYAGAINLNPGRFTTTTGVPGRSIPNLVRGRGEALPFRSNAADTIILENAPIRAQTASEIGRVIRSGGEVRLLHPADVGRGMHQQVIDAVGGTATQTTSQVGGVEMLSTTIRVP